MVNETESSIRGIFEKSDVDKKYEKPSREKIEEIENSYFNLKPNKEQKERDWKKDANKILIDEGSNNRVVNLNFIKSMLALLVSVIIIMVFFLSWGIVNDKFGTSIYDDSSVICEGSNFNVTIPECPTFSCPDLNCGGTNVTINPVVYINSS